VANRRHLSDRDWSLVMRLAEAYSVGTSRVDSSDLGRIAEAVGISRSDLESAFAVPHAPKTSSEQVGICLAAHPALFLARGERPGFTTPILLRLIVTFVASLFIVGLFALELGRSLGLWLTLALVLVLALFYPVFMLLHYAFRRAFILGVRGRVIVGTQSFWGTSRLWERPLVGIRTKIGSATRGDLPGDTEWAPLDKLTIYYVEGGSISIFAGMSPAEIGAIQASFECWKDGALAP